MYGQTLLNFDSKSLGDFMTNQRDEFETTEDKPSDWKMRVAKYIAILPPVVIAGAWTWSLANGYPYNPMDTITGQFWLGFLLWPFAVGYWFFKRDN